LQDSYAILSTQRAEGGKEGTENKNKNKNKTKKKGDVFPLCKTTTLLLYTYSALQKIKNGSDVRTKLKKHE